MHACKHTHTQRIHGHINTFKAQKDIEPGQEVLVRYSTAQWFESKNIPYSDVDYASTMWRPDLQPLPCRENVDLATGWGGRHTFSVLAELPSGTVMDIAPCVKVSLIAVDQFLLWDFVIIDATTQTVCARGCRSLLATRYPHTKNYLRVKSRRYASLCHTPRKSRPHANLTSLPCVCHSQTWTTMYVSVSV